MAAPAGAPEGDSRYVTGKNGERRMKGRTITMPVITGTCAFYLGKKASLHKLAAGNGRLGQCECNRSAWQLGSPSICHPAVPPACHAMHPLSPVCWPKCSLMDCIKTMNLDSTQLPGRQASTRATSGRCTCAALAARTYRM